MNINIGTIIIVSILIILLIFISTSYYMNYFAPEIPITQDEKEYILPTINATGGWFDQFLPDKGIRGKCNIYNTFSNNVKIVDAIQPQSIDKEYNDEICITEGVMVLQRGVRTCGPLPGRGDVCLGNTGKIFKRGEKEEIYEECDGYELCTNPTQVMSQRFSLPRGKLSDETLCLNVAGIVVNCRRANQETLFLTIDVIPSDELEVKLPIPNFEGEIEEEAFPLMLMKISVPQTGLCLAHKGAIMFQDCNLVDNFGFVWAYLKNSVIVDEDSFYAPQIIPRFLAEASDKPKDLQSLIFHQGQRLGLVPFVACGPDDKGCLTNITLTDALTYSNRL